MNIILPFLGRRNYLHGTTLLNALLERSHVPNNFTFKIRKPIFSNHVKLSTNEPENCQAFITSSHSSLYIHQLPMEDPLRREEFDEAAINAGIRENSANFFLPISTYPLIPSLVSAFKNILLTHYPSPARAENSHWAFIGLDVQKWLGNDFSPLSIEKVFCKNGLGRCECGAENGFAGILYFARVDFGA